MPTNASSTITTTTTAALNAYDGTVLKSNHII